MKIAVIVGSVRKDSFNRKLAEFVKKRYGGRFDMEILDLSVLPLYSQDIENQEPQKISEFKKTVKEADAVL